MRGSLCSLVVAGVVLLVAGLETVAAEDDSALLRRQVNYLTEALARTKAEVDGLNARLDNRANDAAGGGGEELSDAELLRDKKYKILDVNKELGMVVLDGGRRDGIVPGLQFAVIQGDRAMATVRVVEVRMAVSGAVLQNAGLAFPRVGDRAIVVTGSRK